MDFNKPETSLKFHLGEYESISLENAMKVDLNTRKEVKFLLPKHILFNDLNHLQKEFFVQLNSKNQPYNSYTTRYWDTQSKNCFKDHVRGKNNRFKIRKRLYEDSGEVVFEIKRKVNDKTIKRRVSSVFTHDLIQSDKDFLIKFQIGYSDFVQSLDIRYNRVTLWDKKLRGRVTIDFDYGINVSGQGHVFKNICIVEFKGSNQFLIHAAQRFTFPLLRYRSSFSKYAIGVLHHYGSLIQFGQNLLPIYKKLCKLNSAA